MTVPQVLELALQHHQAGRLAEAEALYRQILAVDPRHADALHLLGVVAHQAGQNDVAVELIRQAIALKPNYPDACNNLGNALSEKSRLDEAIAAFRQAIALQPNYPEAYSNLGNALRNQGQMEEAIASYHQAIALRPDYSEAYSNLGNALRDQGKLDEAITAYRQAGAFDPNLAGAHYNLGNALRDRGKMGEAIASYRRAIALRPNYSEAYSNLGNALRDEGELEEAIVSYRQAIAVKPQYAEAHCNLGNALREKSQLEEASAACRQAIALKPNLPDAHYSLAHALLVQGDFLRGWEEYEWRWKLKDAASRQRNLTQPRWDGGPLEGRTLLLYAEQGFGDAIQFIRYLPRVAQGGGDLILECPPELQRLFQRMAPGFLVLARGQTLPAFDVHCPLLSLPRVFSADLGNIPQTVPYLYADAAEAAIWRERLSGLGTFIYRSGPDLKVGLVWAGNPAHKNDRNRSLKPANLAPLAEVPGVQFLSLQKGDTAAETETPPLGMKLVDVAEELKDFADTAALLANLDLVIAVDTAVVHLAGAMGKPVWTLLPFAPDWRWLLDRPDSPWYPTMRLFRQPAIGDWDSVMAGVREHLQLLVHSRRASP